MGFGSAGCIEQDGLVAICHRFLEAWVPPDFVRNQRRKLFSGLAQALVLAGFSSVLDNLVLDALQWWPMVLLRLGCNDG